MDQFKIFFNSYIDSILYFSSDQNLDSDAPLCKKYNSEDFDLATLKELEKNCFEFYSNNFEFIKSNLGLAGHDFFLTSNGHGAGFWDGDWEEEIGKKLTEESHKYNEVNFWVSNGKIYCE